MALIATRAYQQRAARVQAIQAQRKKDDERFGAAVGTSGGLAPTTISLSRTSVPEDLAVGVDVGALSNDGTLTATYSIVSDPESKFAINSAGDGLALNASLNFEADTSHPVTVRATTSKGELDQAFTIDVTDIVEDTHNPDLPSGEGTLVYDDNFTVPPTQGNSGSNLKLQGKSGGTAKFILDIGAAVANTTYTARIDPDFTLLSNTGKEAFVGFGFKSGNDFHFTGLKGDGASGLNAYKIYGAAKFNASSGFTTVDDGAAAFGTQAGPNWLQIAIAEDGSTYTLRTSSDGQSWTDEFTDDLPDPIATSTGATTFGIAVFLENSDKGTFSIDIQVWAAVTATSISYAFTHSAGISADSDPYTFNSCALGTAAADRKILVMATVVNGIPIVGMTVGGVALEFIDKKNNAGNQTSIEAWIGDVPTGTSATIEVDMTSSSSLAGIGVYALYGLASNTPLDVEKWDPSHGAGVDVTITTAEGGMTIAGLLAWNDVANPTSTWTQLTEDYDSAIESTWQHSGASMVNTGTSLTFNNTLSTNPISFHVGMALSFG
jgi:hypothetical protein